LADIWVIERRDGAGLAIKPRRESTFGELQRYVAFELRIPRFPHFPHSARANRRAELVTAEFLSWLEFHVGRNQLYAVWPRRRLYDKQAYFTLMAKTV
jgi:hypothetical protein